MRYIYTILLIVVGSTVLTADSGRVQPLEEGYLAAGVEGRVAKDADTADWVFYPAAEITDGKGVFLADKPVALLPCSTLEQIARFAGEERSVDVRLWAMVTEFRGQNALYGLYFLPIKARQTEPAAPPPPNRDEPKEKESVLPGEILQMMQRNRVPDLKRLDEIAVVSADRNLIHRVGLMQFADDGMFFTPDAFGQNAARETYRLLPSKTLEGVQRSMQRTPGRQRYVISGVVTHCEGRAYLLIRRAVRIYTHGNFTP